MSLLFAQIAGVEVDFTLILLIFNVITLLIMIFLEKADPNRIYRWGAVLLLLPFLGFIFYLYFGKGPNLRKRKKALFKYEKDEYYRKIADEQFAYLRDHPLDVNEIHELIQYNLVENNSICTLNNDVKVYADMNEHYEDLFADLESAKVYINIEYFIIQPDELGKKFLDLLIKKVQEGVTVRLVYDEIGSIKTPKSFFKPLIAAGGKVYRFFPSFSKFFSRNVNYRNHRKIVVIDSRVAYTGGSNVGLEYLGNRKGVSPWRDSHVRIVGDAVQLLDLRFLQDYNFVSGEEILPPVAETKKPEKISPIQIVSSGPDSTANGIKNAYIKSIYGAKKRIYLQTPYFVPDESFLLALESEVKSGTDVRLMIPGKPDKWYVYYCTLAYAKRLIEAGVKVYAYDGFLHSKALVVDDTIASVGTFNIDTRSFKLSYEVTAFFYDKNVVATVGENFEEDIKHSRLLDEEYLKNRTLFQRFMERVMILFTPLF